MNTHKLARHMSNTKTFLFLLLGGYFDLAGETQRHPPTAPCDHIVSINDGALSLAKINVYTDMCGYHTVLLPE